MLVEPHDQVRDREHGVVAQPARHHARVLGVAQAADPAVPYVAADAGHHRQREFARDHHRTLLDMKLEVCTHKRFVEQGLLSADGVHISAETAHAIPIASPLVRCLSCRSSALTLPKSDPDPM